MPGLMLPRPARRVADGARAAISVAAASLGFVIDVGSAPAHAQIGGLGFGNIGSDLGVDPRVGNLRPQLERYLNRGAPLAARPAWLFTPSLGVGIGATDNVYQIKSPRRGDVFTDIAPGFDLNGDTARVKLTLNYSPEVRVYASTSSQNRVSQFLNGRGTAVIVPDAIFVDVSASITQQSLTGGGFNQGQNQTYNRQNSVQTTSLSITPYAQHRFGSWADGVVSYSYAKSFQGQQDNNAVTSGNNALGTSGYGALGDLSTTSESATLTSGENLGRIRDFLAIMASQSTGSGSARSGTRSEVQNNLDFGLTHAVTLLSGLGYQQINYGSSLNNTAATSGLANAYNYSGPTYSLGFHFVPNPDLDLTVRYGRHDGANDVTFNGQYSISARVRVMASYSNGVTTDLQQAQNQLATTSVGSGGVVTDTATGAPVQQNGYNATQNGVYRLKRFSASLAFLQERNSYALSLSNDERTALTNSTTLLGNGIVNAGTSTTSTSASLTWQHDLSPDLSLSTSGQYGISTNSGQFVGAGNRDQRTISIIAVLTKQLSKTLNASLSYSYIDQTGGTNALNNGFSSTGVNGGPYTQNTLLLGLRKSF